MTEEGNHENAMLPVTAHSSLDVQPIDWLGLHREYVNTGEMEILVALARSIGARSMLEIGCRDGRTARLMLFNCVSLCRYVGVDVADGYEPALACQRSEILTQPGELVRHDPLFELVVSARGSLDLTPDDFHERFDICYIDGDHSAAAVMHDSKLAFAIVRPGGIITWHDVGNSSVQVTGTVEAFATAHDLPIRRIAETWLAYLIR
jgi:predicted O-methyltransferase YrrM